MTHLSLAAGGLLLAATLAVTPDDDFQRERRGSGSAAKDALEGQRPPALVGREWRNVEAPLDWDQLMGQVVLLDFWGTW